MDNYRGASHNFNNFRLRFLISNNVIYNISIIFGELPNHINVDNISEFTNSIISINNDLTLGYCCTLFICNNFNFGEVLYCNRLDTPAMENINIIYNYADRSSESGVQCVDHELFGAVAEILSGYGFYKSANSIKNELECSRVKRAT